MSARNPKSKTRAGRSQPLADLVSFRLRRLTNMYTKASARVYEREFGLTLNEWRIIALLSSAGTLSLSRLSQQAQFDRGLTSRVVTELIERGLVSRQTDPNDGRGVALALSAGGNDLVARVEPVARRRNTMLLSCLTREETEAFDAILDKLTEQAHRMLAEVEGAAEPPGGPAAARQRNLQP